MRRRATHDRDRSPSATRARRSAAGADAVPLPERDVRRKRPPALSFLLRMETLRRVARVVSLLALDFAGVFAGDLHRADASRRWCAATVDVDASPRTRPKRLRRRSPTWSRRCCSRARASTPTAPQRPGLSRIVASLFQVDGRRAGLRRRQRRAASPATTSSTARCSSRSSTSARCAARYERVTGRAAARGRLPAPRGARRLRASTSRTSRTRSRDAAHAPIEVVGFISLTPRPDNGLRSLGHARGPRARCSTRTASTR